jgi:hypothetical protein
MPPAGMSGFNWKGSQRTTGAGSPGCFAFHSPSAASRRRFPM